FPAKSVRRGPVSVGCGHLMHFRCFEHYCSGVARRQLHQIARHHPERLLHKEFVCPLCKALGNAFLPIIWKGKEESVLGILSSEISFDMWIEDEVGKQIRVAYSYQESDVASVGSVDRSFSQRLRDMSTEYGSSSFISSFAQEIDHLSSKAWKPRA